MKLNDFMEIIPQVIVQKGQQYFSDKRVISLEEEDGDLWFAEVAGSENYFVSVGFDGDEIDFWECDCPFEGEICKHVVALLCAVKEDKSKNNEEDKNSVTKKRKTNTVEAIFNKVSNEEIKKFVISRFSKHHGFKNEFIAYFAEYLDEDAESKYKLLVKNLIKTSVDRYGFVDYRSANSLTKALIDLLNKAQSLLEKRNLMESLAICKTMIEEIPLLTQSMDDSAGGIYEIIDFAFDIFTQIAQKVPPELKDVLFQYCIERYPETKRYGFDFGNGFLTLLPELITIKEQETQFLKMIDEQIEIEKQNEYSRYREKHLIKIKIDYFLNHNQKEHAWKLVEENKRHPEFMKMIVDETLKEKDFVKAIALCFEGIKIAVEEHYSGTVREWNEKLLSIYETTNNTIEIRKMSKELFFSSGCKMDFYKKLKITYEPEDWVKICEEIIEKIRGKDKSGGYAAASILAKIFIEEKYNSRLLKLLEINSDGIHFVDEFAKYLKNEYPQEIISFYDKGIRKYAENTGRSYYHEVVGYLKNLQKINGSGEKVKTLVNYFRQTYKNRRAMMEILNKQF